jgi:hypothetical protein
LIELYICAPNKPGTYTYDFQMGTDVENLFGDVVKITLKVEEDEIEEPEEREEDPDDLDFEEKREEENHKIEHEDDFFSQIDRDVKRQNSIMDSNRLGEEVNDEGPANHRSSFLSDDNSVRNMFKLN